VKKGAVSIAAICLAVILLLAFYAGVFDRVDISVQTVGPFQCVYREHRGKYQGIKYVLKDVYTYLKEEKSIETTVGIAVYYDNPEKVEEDSLRSIGGCLVALPVAGLEEPYRYTKIARTDAVVGTFPIRSFLSYMSGVLKFYPKLEQFTVGEDIEVLGPVMELYDMEHNEIRYIAPMKQFESELFEHDVALLQNVSPSCR
jgi:hypothetical protein